MHGVDDLGETGSAETPAVELVDRSADRVLRPPADEPVKRLIDRDDPRPEIDDDERLAHAVDDIFGVQKGRLEQALSLFQISHVDEGDDHAVDRLLEGPIREDAAEEGSPFSGGDLSLSRFESAERLPRLRGEIVFEQGGWRYR